MMVSIKGVDIDSNSVLPVTVANYRKHVDTTAFNVDNVNDVCESILFFFESTVGFDMDKYSAYADNDIVSIFNNLHNDLTTYAIIDQPEFDNTVNITSVGDFIVLSLMRRYLGKFFPVYVSGVTLSEQFMRNDSGAVTNEMYITDVN